MFEKQHEFFFFIVNKEMVYNILRTTEKSGEI